MGEVLKNIIIILGGPGSGKGTVATELMRGHEYNYIETGALFRNLPDDSEVAQIMMRGDLIPDEKIFPLIEWEAQGPRDILFDGFPRNVAQAEWMLSYFNANITALYLHIPESVMIERIHNRLAQGSGRADDARDEIVRRRLGTFKKETLPMIEFLQKATGVKFFEIDATLTIPKVFAEVKAKIKL